MAARRNHCRCHFYHFCDCWIAKVDKLAWNMGKHQDNFLDKLDDCYFLFHHHITKSYFDVLGSIAKKPPSLRENRWLFNLPKDLKFEGKYQKRFYSIG